MSHDPPVKLYKFVIVTEGRVMYPFPIANNAAEALDLAYEEVVGPLPPLSEGQSFLNVMVAFLRVPLGQYDKDFFESPEYRRYRFIFPGQLPSQEDADIASLALQAVRPKAAGNADPVPKGPRPKRVA